MNFKEIDIISFLKASYPLRFQDITPYLFEDFIAFSLERDGYVVTQTPKSGDYGADLIVEKDGRKTAIQVKRYQSQQKVGVAEINHIIAAREFYRTDDSLVITTSSYTQAAAKMAAGTETYLWDWEDLEDFISEVYFDRQSFADYFGDYLPDDVRSERFSVEMRGIEEFDDNLRAAHLDLANLTGTNTNIRIELPMLVTKQGRQVNATAFAEGSFYQGLMVSDVKVEVVALFTRKYLDSDKPDGKIYLRLYEAGMDVPELLETKVRKGRPGCFVVSYCFGRGSEHYWNLITLRDQMVRTGFAGKLLVNIYYLSSPHLIRYIDRNVLLRVMILPALRFLILFVSFICERILRPGK